jgi:hypothetical protein
MNERMAKYDEIFDMWRDAPKVVTEMAMTTRWNKPDSVLTKGVAHRPDGSIDYEWCYEHEDGSLSRLIPPEETPPMSDEEKREIEAALEADAALHLDDFADSRSSDEIEAEVQAWREHREEYFRERGTTAAEFDLKHRRC